MAWQLGICGSHIESRCDDPPPSTHLWLIHSTLYYFRFYDANFVLRLFKNNEISALYGPAEVLSPIIL